MKKLLVVLLSVLLLFSFTSCEKDKSAEVQAEYEAKIKAQQEKNEELVKNFEDFLDAYKYDYKDLQTLWNCYDYYDSCRLDGRIINATLSDSCYPYITASILENYGFINLLEEGQHYGGGSMYPKKNPAPSGTVTGKVTKSTNNYNLTFTDNKFTVPYIIYGTDETQAPVKTGDLEVTIDGTYKEENTEEKHTVNYDITINDQRYQMSYTYDKTTKKVTAASVNGKDVEIRLINAEDADIADIVVK